MQFRLTYEGPLFGSKRNDPRASHKQDIRKVFHSQLKRLWEISPTLQPRHESLPDMPFYVERVRPANADELADRFSCGEYRLVPLVTEESALLCGLDILFLRPDPPGSILASGDIDNRLKTLFDALRIPQDTNELGGHKPTDGENPFFCLLRDDKLITHVAVETDMLLQPIGSELNVNDARIVITVSIRPSIVLLANLGFL